MEWFVITDEEHLGPYEESALLEMYENGDLTDESFIWQEGWEEAVQFQEVFVSEEEETPVLMDDSLDLSLESLDDEEEEESKPEPQEKPASKNIPGIEQFKVSPDSDLPPDLPPLPTEADIKKDLGLEEKKQKVTAPKIETKAEEESFDEIAREAQVSAGEVVDSEEMDFEGDFADDDEEIEEGEKKKKWAKVILVVVLLFAVLGGGVFWFLNQKTELIRPSNMSLKDFNRLKETVAMGGIVNQFSFALSKDKKTIWVATNNPLSGKVFVKIKGIKNEALGDYIEAKGSGELKDHLIEIKNLKFVLGSRFVDGIYEVAIESTSNLEVPIQRRFLHENNTKIKYVGKVLISNFDMKTFKKQLKKYLAKKFNNSQSYWQEIVQKYQTVKMITDQIRVGFEDLFKNQKAPWDKKIVNFEAQYRNKWGQFFTEFVKANEASYEKLALKKFEEQEKVLASYNNLSNLAINIGETAMVALEKLQGFDFSKADEKSINALMKNNSNEFQKIITSCDEKIKEIGE